MELDKNALDRYLTTDPREAEGLDPETDAYLTALHAEEPPPCERCGGIGAHDESCSERKGYFAEAEYQERASAAQLLDSSLREAIIELTALRTVTLWNVFDLADDVAQACARLLADIQAISPGIDPQALIDALNDPTEPY